MWLVLDTAGPVCAVGLFDGRSAGAQRADHVGRGHAERLMPLVEEVMSEAGAKWADVNAIAVTRGPGSFTGLRVGLSAARGFGFALGVPVYGVSVLDALARDAVGDGPFTLVLSAGRGAFWCASYTANGEAVGEPWSASEAAFLPPVGFERIARPDNGSASLAEIHAIAMSQPRPAAAPGALYLRAPDAKPQPAALHRAPLA